MIESLRARLTSWYVSVLAAVLISVCILIYVLMQRALHSRIDENLRTVTSIAVTSLTNDLAEGQSVLDAAKSTAAELFSDQAMLAIYDASGRLLAEEGRDDDLALTLPDLSTIPVDRPLLRTVTEADDEDDRHRIAIRHATIEPSGTEYLILVGSDLERTDEELQSLRDIFLYVIPGALVIAGLVGWLLARHSLSPVMQMAERARRIGVENLDGRIPVANPRDELGRLASTFNELLERLSRSFAQQRQFMADASHELRSPIATTRTAAAVALQQRHRDEPDYRQALEIVEQQTTRLSRVVDDMFTLARADAGNYPVQRVPLYLDEVCEEVARAASVVAGGKQIRIQCTAATNAPFVGDEDLLRRMMRNLLDNAVRHAPVNSTVRIVLERATGGYVITIADAGPGIPPQIRPHIFERFVRGDAARDRAEGELDGAGLGLAIARWAARQHGGDIVIVESSSSGTVFRIDLPLLSDKPG
jgi:two-component system, OmpR family, sensor kinase